MGFSFLDIMETVAPIGIAMIPGIGIPAAIALSAATKGATTAAKGGDWGDIALNTAIGGATGAAGAGISGALSKGLSGSATKATEKAMDVGVEQVMGGTADAIAKGGIEAIPELTEAGLKTGTDAMVKAAPKVARLEKLAKITSGGREGGEFSDKTKQTLSTLKTVGKTASALGDAKDIVAPPPQPPRFTQVQSAGMPQQPFMPGSAMDKYRTQVVGGGYY